MREHFFPLPSAWFADTHIAICILKVCLIPVRKGGWESSPPSPKKSATWELTSNVIRDSGAYSPILGQRWHKHWINFKTWRGMGNKAGLNHRGRGKSSKFGHCSQPLATQRAVKCYFIHLWPRKKSEFHPSVQRPCAAFADWGPCFSKSIFLKGKLLWNLGSRFWLALPVGPRTLIELKGLALQMYQGSEWTIGITSWISVETVAFHLKEKKTFFQDCELNKKCLGGI